MLSRAEVEHKLCDEIVKVLRETIAQDGKASLAVSGGSTPLGLFERLAKADLDWNKITVIPVDERLVEDGHKDQNGTLIKNHLLQKKAAAAIFYPLVNTAKDPKNNLKLVIKDLDQLPRPLSVVILGMGTDGHTASLFPKSEALSKGLSLNFEQPFLNVIPLEAPYQRISMSRNFISKAKHIFLHFYGEEKQLVLEKAKEEADEKKYPIYAFLDLPQLEIFNADLQ